MSSARGCVTLTACSASRTLHNGFVWPWAIFAECERVPSVASRLAEKISRDFQVSFVIQSVND